MNRTELANLIAAGATVISFVLLVPQIVRLWRTGRTAGVSPAWAAIGMAINVGWLAYVIGRELWIAIPSNLVSVVAFLTTFWLLHRNRAEVRPGLFAGSAVGLTFLGVGVGFGWDALGTVIALSYTVQFAPSVVTIWRTWAPVGVSPSTWILALSEAVGWGGYGLLIEDPPIILFGLVAGTASVLVLSRVVMTRGREPRAPVRPTNRPRHRGGRMDVSPGTPFLDM